MVDAVSLTLTQIICCTNLDLRHFTALVHNCVFNSTDTGLERTIHISVILVLRLEELGLSSIMRTLLNLGLLLVSLVKPFLFCECVVHVLGLHDLDAVFAGLELNVTEDGDLLQERYTIYFSYFSFLVFDFCLFLVKFCNFLTLSHHFGLEGHRFIDPVPVVVLID